MSVPSEDDTDVTDADDRTGSVDTDDRTGAAGPTDAESGPPAHDAFELSQNRCAEIRLESGDLVIYDGAASDAWLQSSVAVEIASLR